MGHILHYLLTWITGKVRMEKQIQKALFILRKTRNKQHANKDSEYYFSK